MSKNHRLLVHCTKCDELLLRVDGDTVHLFFPSDERVEIGTEADHPMAYIKCFVCQTKVPIEKRVFDLF